MKDDLNIRELYDGIIREMAASNGTILMEDVKISADGVSPDTLKFEGEKYNYDQNTRPFSFIGQGTNLIGYVNNSGGTHPYIFNAFIKLAAALGLTEFPSTMSWMASRYEGSKLSDSKKILASDEVSLLGKLIPEDLKYFVNNQKSGMLTDMRRATRSGRIWRSIPSETLGKKIAVVVFWCKESEVGEEYLKSLKANFKLGDFFWSATDSNNFNFYGDSYRDIGGKDVKELRSRVYPELSHNDIVDILMRAHSGFKLSNRDEKVVWEFRGYDPDDLKAITGGYDMPAQYHYNKQMSESFKKS